MLVGTRDRHAQLQRTAFCFQRVYDLQDTFDRG